MNADICITEELLLLQQSIQRIEREGLKPRIRTGIMRKGSTKDLLDDYYYEFSVSLGKGETIYCC